MNIDILNLLIICSDGVGNLKVSEAFLETHIYFNIK